MRPRTTVESFNYDPLNLLDRNLQALFHMVDQFAVAMKEKLRKKSEEHWRGWDLLSEADCVELIRVQLAKLDPVDMANLSAFLWNAKEGD